MLYERNLEAHIFSLREELLTGTYRHGQYTPFTIHDPKKRRIHKATVNDRIVHQAIVNAIEPIFERQFIFDSFSCRVGKGTHAAVTRLRQFLRAESRSNTRTVYALKCDVRKFFDSVDHEVLLALLRRRISDPRLLALLQEILASFSTQPSKGIPLGNLTSQLFANVYLHELDRFMKHKIGARFYIRYCDDFIVVDRSRGNLLLLVNRIREFLRNELVLELHPSKIQVRSWGQGIDFLGYVLLPHCTVLLTMTKQRMFKKIAEHVEAANRGLIDEYALRQSTQSYLGLLKHCNGYNTEREVRNMVWWESEYAH